MCSRQDWRVKPGGIFHQKPVTYSPDTHALLKELLRESKMSMMERKRVEDMIKKGEPLPLPQRSRSAPSKEETKIITKTFHKKRSQRTIVESGAYQPPPVPPRSAHLDYVKEKARLQRLMAFGKTTPDNPSNQENPPSQEFNITRKELFQHLLDEIKDREEFLNDMEKLGQGNQYRSQINLEIAEKVRLMEQWDKKLLHQIEKDRKSND